MRAWVAKRPGGRSLGTGEDVVRNYVAGEYVVGAGVRSWRDKDRLNW